LENIKEINVKDLQELQKLKEVRQKQKEEQEVITKQNAFKQSRVNNFL